MSIPICGLRAVKALIVVTALSAFSAPVALGQEIAAESLGDGRFRLVLRTDTVLETHHAQSLLLPKAIELCREQEPVLGRYRFESKAPIEAAASLVKAVEFQFTQDLACGHESANPQIATARNTAFGVEKSDRAQGLEEFIRAASTSYLAARGDGRFEDAYLAFSEAMREFLPFDKWKQQNSEFNAAAGARQSTTIWRVTVYDNPPNAPEPGVYIAADYESAFKRVPFQCGYLIWFLGSDRHFVITREESGSLPGGTVEKLPAQQVAEIRRQFGCQAR